MKLREIILLTAVSLLFYAGSSFAGEFTGADSVVKVLKEHKVSPAKLKKLNLKLVTEGEFTGAGIVDVEFLITNKKILDMDDVTHIYFKNPSAAKNLSDIRGFEFDQKRLGIKRIKGALIRK